MRRAQATWEDAVPRGSLRLRAALAGSHDVPAYAAQRAASLRAAADASRERQSIRPIVGFLLTGIGKLAMGRGLAYMVTGIDSGDSVMAGVGGGVAGAGFAMAVAVALSFGRYVAAVDPGYAHVVKAASISATVLVLAGNILRGMENRALPPPAALPLVLLAAGFGTLTYSLPTFAAYAKVVEGRLRVLDGSLQSHLFCCVGAGLGFGYAVVSPDPSTPGAVGDGVLAGALVLLLYGIGLLRLRLLLEEASRSEASACA